MQLYFVYLLTSSQDVSCHPEGGQTADHGPPPQARHELWEVGEDNRDRPANPAGGVRKKHLNSVTHFIPFEDVGCMDAHTNQRVK